MIINLMCKTFLNIIY